MSNHLANSTKNNNSNHSADITYANKPWQAPVDSKIMARAEQRVIKQLINFICLGYFVCNNCLIYTGANPY